MKTFNEFIQESDSDEKWRNMAIGAFPVLLWCAVNKDKITYEELNKYLLKNGFSQVDYKGSSKRFIGHPAGLVGEYMLELDLPIVNSIVVRSGSGIPGNGAEYFIGKFLNQGELRKYKNISDKNKRKFLEDYVWPEIYAYNWEDFLNVNNINLKAIKMSDFRLIKKNKKSKEKSLKQRLNKFKKIISKRNKKPNQMNIKS